jgi:hypothetical protein
MILTVEELAEHKEMRSAEKLPLNYVMNHIEYFMGRHKLSTFDLAKCLGVTWLVARAIESGTKTPAEEQVLKMSKLFKCYPENITRRYSKRRPFIKKFLPTAVATTE